GGRGRCCAGPGEEGARRRQRGGGGAVGWGGAWRGGGAFPGGRVRPPQRHRAFRSKRARVAVVAQGMGGQLARGCCLMQTLEQIVSDVAAPAPPRPPHPRPRPLTPHEGFVFFRPRPTIDENIGLLAERCLILLHGGL